MWIRAQVNAVSGSIFGETLAISLAMVATLKVSIQNLFLSKLFGVLKELLRAVATTRELTCLKPSLITA